MMVYLTVICAAISCSAVLAAPAPVDEALPLVGTAGHGHTYPGAAVPFGFVQLSPDTRTTGWDACGGYSYGDTNILGFSHTHLSGTGIADMGDLLVLPVTGSLEEVDSLRSENFQSSFSHTNELAEPGYYRVKLDRYDVLAELTATAHAGMHRYTFSSPDAAHLLIDLVHGLGTRPIEAAMNVESSNLLTGYRICDGWAKNRHIFFALESSQPWTSIGFEADGTMLAPGSNGAKGRNLRAHLDYPGGAGQQLVLRVGLSPVSVEGAIKNLRTEMPGWDFDAVRQAARDTWNGELSRIQIECSNPNLRQTFYSCFYHTMTAPTLFNDADGTYRGPDGQIHPPAGFQCYSTMSLWDIFRAELPLMTIAHPERVDDLVQSMLAFYQQSPDHALPMWPLANYETWCMIAYHSVPFIWDAYAKGFHGFDAQLAYQAMRDTAMSGRFRQDEYQKLGYIPWVNGKTAATSRTLEMAYDDWCIAQMAHALGKTDDADLFTKRSQNYRNVWDPATRFFRSKKEDGTYQEPFNPKEVSNGHVPASGYYTEANAWQYAFAVFHDVPGMIQLYGGREAFISRLDELFDQDSDMTHWVIDVSGLYGQYAHGNEPCHHVAYLYVPAGAQYKTALRVHTIMLTQYDNTPEGLCGNDDCGQISAWYVFSALGLYPLNPASQTYVIGSPLVQKAVIKLDPKYGGQGTFTILAPNASGQNIYVKSAKLNGQPLERPWITHQEIMQGGTLELEMSILPNKEWGAGG